MTNRSTPSIHDTWAPAAQPPDFSAAAALIPRAHQQAIQKQIGLLVAKGASWSEAGPQLQLLIEQIPPHPRAPGPSACLDAPA